MTKLHEFLPLKHPVSKEEGALHSFNLIFEAYKQATNSSNEGQLIYDAKLEQFSVRLSEDVMHSIESTQIFTLYGQPDLQSIEFKSISQKLLLVSKEGKTHAAEYLALSLISSELKTYIQ